MRVYAAAGRVRAVSAGGRSARVIHRAHRRLRRPVGAANHRRGAGRDRFRPDGRRPDGADEAPVGRRPPGRRAPAVRVPDLPAVPAAVPRQPARQAAPSAGGGKLTMQEMLAYESAVADGAAARRPIWVHAVVGLYALVVVGIALLPFVIPLIDRDSTYPPSAAIGTLLVLCEMALLFVPVRVASRRPVTRRSLWLPLLGSGCLAALLGFGASVALAEYAKLDKSVPWVIVGTAGAVWLAWTLVFWMMAHRTSPDAVATKLHRWLLAGSVLELLVAVPTHLVVRRRTECCAGLGTAIGIGAGILVMLLAFGPSVGFLYYRRWKQIRSR